METIPTQSQTDAMDGPPYPPEYVTCGRCMGPAPRLGDGTSWCPECTERLDTPAGGEGE